MEDSEVSSVENGSSSESERPLNPPDATYKQCFSAEREVAVSCKRSLIRHQSLVSQLYWVLLQCCL